MKECAHAYADAVAEASDEAVTLAELAISVGVMIVGARFEFACDSPVVVGCTAVLCEMDCVGLEGIESFNTSAAAVGDELFNTEMKPVEIGAATGSWMVWLDELEWFEAMPQSPKPGRHVSF